MTTKKTAKKTAKKTKTKCYRVIGSVTGSAYLGDYEADNSDAAIKMASDEHIGSVSLCHHCSSKVEYLEIEDVHAEEIDE